MRRKIDPRVPRCKDLIIPVVKAIQELGGSASNNEIFDRVVRNLELPADVMDIMHKGRTNLSEVEYQMAWAKTNLSNAGFIENSARSVWSISKSFKSIEELDVSAIMKRKKNEKADDDVPEDDDPTNDATEFPEEVKPWRARLSEILQSMDPFGFERLAQRVLRECGFTQVEVTRKTGDGGIDGTGKLKINGIFSFNVAFQCKRYSGLVGAPAVRDFRGSLTTDIEKGVLITTGAFSKAARDEASNPGKQQIDLIDGEEFISKIVEYGIGVKEVKAYEIDEEFFQKI